ncbi:Protein disulfide-isomerase A3 [Halotydeus destructor]|nr:Protein disulfide-isomerase A3 [Halotydeus destructor]
MMLKLFSCLLLLSAPLLALSESDDVLDLSSNTVDSFKAEIGVYDAILVEFFAPWCGHCKRLAPEYTKAATALKQSDPPVPLAKVDCTVEAGGKDICSEYGVQGYPTLKIFKGGEFSQEYQGPRDADGIVKYMRSQVGPASRLYQSVSALNDKVKDSKEVVVVGVFNDDSDDLYKQFNRVADKLRESVQFGHVFVKQAGDDVSSLTVVKDVTAPAVVVVRPAAVANKFEPSYVSYTDGDLKEFVQNNYHGRVGVRTQSNMEDFKGPLVVVYYGVDYVKNPKGTNYWRNRVLKVAKNFENIHFAIADADAFAGELEEYGLKPSTGKDATPVVGARGKDGKKYIMKEKFSVEAFESFVENFAEGKLEAHVKSEEEPEDNSGPVYTATGKNFDELVTNTDADVLIEFYAPWCGHCKKLAPTWEELGQTFKDESGIRIVKLDATANDVPPQFIVHGFPTIYFYPADSKTPKKYEGGRDVDDFVKYLAKYSSKDLKGFTRDGQKKEVKEEL